MVPVSFLRLLNYVYLSITYSLPGHKSKPLRNRFISPAAGHTRRCYKYRAVPAPPRRSPAGRVETHRESCHYGGRRGDPPAPPVPGHAEAHGPSAGPAGDGTHHRPAQAPRDRRDRRHPVLHAGGSAVLFRGRTEVGGPPALLHRGGPAGHRRQRAGLRPLPGGRGLPGHQRGQRLRPGSHCRHGVPSGQAGPGHPGPLPSSRAPGVRAGPHRRGAAGGPLCGGGRW